MGRVFQYAESYLKQLDPGHWIEIGSSRTGDGHLRNCGDGGSTAILARWAKDYCTYKKLITVDIDPVQCQLVKQLQLDNVEIVNSTGEEYLKNFSMQTSISLLHLDNFDWDWHPENSEEFVKDQQKRYLELGMDMNNINSQRAHLKQMMLALPAMAEKSIVICDDTWYNKWWGQYAGKSGAVIPLLLNNGFTVLYTEEQPVYGTILSRGLV
jgi:hypothetical protein